MSEVAQMRAVLAQFLNAQIGMPRGLAGLSRFRGCCPAAATSFGRRAARTSQTGRGWPR